MTGMLSGGKEAGFDDGCAWYAGISQAREFRGVLRAHGIESAPAIHPEQAHLVRSCPARTDVLARILNWFERHMPADRRDSE
ncbi:hypothetical protein [Sciscionella marina]|uniref:hypothetical protein n=1 Tax=Sciscionella marina TaxID=508770 RepID=UPI0012F6CF52|nr:hypothetical protein [Sciscionella marina]